MSSLSDLLHLKVTTKEFAELVDDVEARLSSLLYEEGGAPGALGQGGEGGRQVSACRRGRLELLRPAAGGDEKEGGEHQSAIESQYNTCTSPASPPDHCDTWESPGSHLGVSCSDCDCRLATVITPDML